MLNTLLCIDGVCVYIYLILQVPLTVCYLHGSGEEELMCAVEALTEASSRGHWVLLHNVQLCPSLLMRLPALLDQLPPRDGWKVWLSVQGDCGVLPPSLLHSADKLVLDPPRDLYSGVLYCLGCLAGGAVSSSSRPEWLPVLHCISMLHTTVRLRSHMYSHAWVTDFPWTHLHFMVSHSCCTLILAQSPVLASSPGSQLQWINFHCN